MSQPWSPKTELCRDLFDYINVVEVSLVVSLEKVQEDDKEAKQRIERGLSGVEHLRTKATELFRMLRAEDEGKA